MCWVGFLPVCMCTIWMPGTFRGQKRPLDPLEMKFQRVVSSHIGGGNRR